MLTPEFLTVAEAAALLCIGQRTAYDIARERRIPAAKVGGQWRIRRADFDAWLERGGEAASSSKGERT